MAGVRTAFGAGSAAAHEALGHVRLDLDLPGLRVDVDDARPAEATRLGLGPHSAWALARATVWRCAGHHPPHRRRRSGPALLDDGVEVDLPPDAAQRSGLRHLRVGPWVEHRTRRDGAAATRAGSPGSPGEDIHSRWRPTALP